ncbi:MAG: acyltransferase [Lachnospiraceae bacterium]|nr:acyltransferase [Lachnospiraceae bacterium]
MNDKVSSKYNINLAILRIIAMVMVVSIHVGINVHWTQYVYAGQYGVQLFFILSGYLIFVSLESGISAREFYKKRMLRIVPEYWTALVLYWIVGVIEYLHTGGIIEAIGQYDSPYGIRYLRYFTFTNVLLPSNNWYLWNNRNAWWTMSSFMVFYLLAPLLHIFINRFYKAILMLTFLLYCTPIFRQLLLRFLSGICEGGGEGYHLNEFCAYMPFSELYCFFFGIVIYFAVREGKQLIYIVYLLFILCIFNAGVYLWECLLTLCLIGGVQSQLEFGSRIKKIVAFLSEGSFSVYCIHSRIVEAISSATGEISEHNSINFLIVFCITCGVCYGYYGLYQYIKNRVCIKR